MECEVDEFSCGLADAFFAGAKVLPRASAVCRVEFHISIDLVKKF
jgi:hypothetical protein